ncbi:unnamed protein product, partial [Didymodactylos carnosus]
MSILLKYNRCSTCFRLKSIVYYTYRSITDNNIFSLQERGLFREILPPVDPELTQSVMNKKQTVYCGFDPTAESLHIGNLIALIGLLHWQRAGHQPLALIGSATVLLGDPSGRINERQQLLNDEIVTNTTNIEKLIQKIFQNHEKYIWKGNNDKGQRKLLPVSILNNLSWYKDMNVIHFLSTYGRHFRMGPLLARKTIAKRIESAEGLSVNEFLYQLFQAYDWYYLFRNFNCRFQLGGVDQLGNIDTGRNFIKKMTHLEEIVHGVMLPLLTNEAGEKLGKSTGNSISIDENICTPYEIYQFFRSTPDSKVEEYLKLFTFLPLLEIQQLMQSHRNKPQEYAAQIKLAKQVTLLVHGDDGLQSAIRTTEALFAENIDLLSNLTEKEINGFASSIPTMQMTLNPELTLLELCMAVKGFSNEQTALNVIDKGGVRINHKKVQNPHAVLVFGLHILPNKITVLRI